MNILKRVKPVLFIACFTFGILIYASTTIITVIDSDSIDKISQLHKQAEISAMNDQRTFLIEQNNDLSSTSRGKEERYTDNNIVSKTENKAAPAVAEPAASAANVIKAAAPAAPVIKAATPAAPVVAPGKTVVKATEAPVKTAAEPAAVPKAVQSVPAAPAAPAEVKATVTASPTAPAVKATVPPAPASSYEDDLDLLARLITAEAQGEPYDAQVAVGAVVMNRVKSSDWPNTIKEVIYQNINGYYQFTPVVNGWIDKPAEAESIKAAKAALSGADPTNGAQFYYDDKVTNTWILAKPVSAQFGHMIFAFK